jgi:hypothetical protein
VLHARTGGELEAFVDAVELPAYFPLALAVDRHDLWSPAEAILVEAALPFLDTLEDDEVWLEEACAAFSSGRAVRSRLAERLMDALL